jgi:TPR repeat protein
MEEQKRVKLLGEADHLFDEKRYDEALIRYKELGSEGHVYALSMVGWINHYGLGVPVDLTEAHKWYLLAAERGSPLAQFQLGNLSVAGSDFSTGMNWYERSAAQGYMPALFWLAYHFEIGNPAISIDKGKAYRLLQQAGDAGHFPSIIRLAKKKICGEFGFGQRVPGLILLIMTYLKAIWIGRKDPHSDRFRK